MPIPKRAPSNNVRAPRSASSVAASSRVQAIGRATPGKLAACEWIRTRHNLLIPGPCEPKRIGTA
jgi:hypothetical protein